MAILKSLAGLLYSNDKVVSVVGETAVNGGIESGTGYIKYPDGTLICSGVLGLVTTTDASGNNFRSPASPFTYAATFIASPAVSLGVSGGANSNIWCSGFNMGISGGSLYILAANNSANGNPSYVAVGRWK